MKTPIRKDNRPTTPAPQTPSASNFPPTPPPTGPGQKTAFNLPPTENQTKIPPPNFGLPLSVHLRQPDQNGYWDDLHRKGIPPVVYPSVQPTQHGGNTTAQNPDNHNGLHTDGEGSHYPISPTSEADVEMLADESTGSFYWAELELMAGSEGREYPDRGVQVQICPFSLRRSRQVPRTTRLNAEILPKSRSTPTTPISMSVPATDEDMPAAAGDAMLYDTEIPSQHHTQPMDPIVELRTQDGGHDEIIYLRQQVTQSMVLRPENTRAHLAPHPTSDNNFDEHFDLREDRRRGRDDYEDDDVVYTGTLEAAKRPRIQAGSVDDDEDGTPLREMAEGEVGCEACGCSCQARVDGPGGGIGGRRMGGSGSTTLSVGVRANILELLLGQTSLINQLRGKVVHGRRIDDWADIAEVVGARGRDFDRVRHCASGLQKGLPDRMRRGKM